MEKKQSNKNKILMSALQVIFVQCISHFEILGDFLGRLQPIDTRVRID